MNRDIGEKLWEAFVALGVVDPEGRHKLVSRSEELEQRRDAKEEGRKEGDCQSGSMIIR